MSSRRQSSSSQGNQWNGDYTWSVPGASTVDGCGRRLSDLSLMTPSAPSNSDYPADSTSCWNVSGYPGVSQTDQSDFANPSWGSVYVNYQPGNSADFPTFSEPEQIPLPSTDCPQFYPSSLSEPGNDNFIDHEAGYTTSTHVSPSSSSRSKQSTIDDSQGTQSYRDYRKPEKKPSRGEVPVQEKKKKRHQGNHHQGASGGSRKPNPSFDFRNRGAVRYSPYPRSIPDADLYDLPASSLNDAGPQTAQYISAGSQNSEEDYDMCDSLGSPFSTIGPTDYIDMPETSS